MKWLMAMVIAAGLIRLGDTQPPDDSREPDEAEQDACEMTDIEEQQDTQAQASSNGTEASGYAVQTSLDDDNEVKEFVEKLMHEWGGHEFFLSPTKLKEERKNYQKWRKSQAERPPAPDNDWRGSQLEECLDAEPDGDICCETHNTLQRECGEMIDMHGKPWFVICPNINGKRHVQYADVGTCRVKTQTEL
nr:hypothetical protein BaRGS_021980 [Batillaria attramentaria]